MKKTSEAVIIADNMETAKAFARYLEFVCAVNGHPYNYEMAINALCGDHWNNTELVILEIYRSYPNRGLRNEGLRVAEKILAHGEKKCLLFSQLFPTDDFRSDIYWDFRHEPLRQKIDMVLESRDQFIKLTEYYKHFPDYSDYIGHHHH
jgi:hypothetical protein